MESEQSCGDVLKPGVQASPIPHYALYTILIFEEKFVAPLRKFVSHLLITVLLGGLFAASDYLV